MNAVTIQEYLELTKNITGFISFISTDKCWIKKWPLSDSAVLENDADKIIEVRIFNEDEEIKIYRDTVDRKFYLRHICDNNDELLKESVHYDEYYDERQFINLDHKGQGSFQYSIETDKRASGAESMLRVRYYFEKDLKNSRAYVKDWRAVDVEGGL